MARLELRRDSRPPKPPHHPHPPVKGSLSPIYIVFFCILVLIIAVGIGNFVLKRIFGEDQAREYFQTYLRRPIGKIFTAIGNLFNRLRSSISNAFHFLRSGHLPNPVPAPRPHVPPPYTSTETLPRYEASAPEPHSTSVRMGILHSVQAFLLRFCPYSLPQLTISAGWTSVTLLRTSPFEVLPDPSSSLAPGGHAVPLPAPLEENFSLVVLPGAMATETSATLSHGQISLPPPAYVCELHSRESFGYPATPRTSRSSATSNFLV